jgi:YidC/Oxa1 family membrane protein insertase
MDRNSIIGLSLIFVILITFAYVNQPDEEEVRAAQRQRDSIAMVQLREDSVTRLMATEAKQEDSLVTVDTAVAKSRYGVFAPFSNGTDDFATIENDEVKITVASKGGRVYRDELKKQKRSD